MDVLSTVKWQGLPKALSVTAGAGHGERSRGPCGPLGQVAPASSRPAPHHACHVLLPAFCTPAPLQPLPRSPSTGLSVHPGEGGSSYLQVLEQALEQGVKAVTLELTQGAQEVL